MRGFAANRAIRRLILQQKNTMKHHIKIDELSPRQGAVVCCHNLIKSRESGRDVLTVAPGLLSSGQGVATPLASFNDTEGQPHTLFSITDDTISCGWMIEHCGAKQSAATDSPLLCAAPTSGGFIAMTSQGAIRLTFDGENWSASADASIHPRGISLEATDCGSITAYTSPLNLTDVTLNRDNSTIGKTGLSRLSGTLSAAYTRLTELAADGGMWLQPVVARYHLLNSAGERLYSSMPMTFCSEAGWECCGEISVNCSATSTDALDVPSIPLTANTYKLQLRLSADDASRLRTAGVAAIEIETSPQIHPFDRQASAAYRIVRPTSADPTLTVALPGATTHFTRRDELRRSTILSIMADIDSATSIERTLSLPKSGGTIEISRSRFLSVDAESALTSQLRPHSTASTKTSAPNGLIGMITSPNRFAAATVTTMGDTIVWGDITPLSTLSINIHELCRDHIDDPFTGLLTVEMADGSSRHISLSGSRLPRAWAPTVSYPDINATSLTLDLLGQSGLRLHGSITLHPDGSHSRASHINLQLKQAALTATSAPMPQPAASDYDTDRHPGAIVACRISSPLIPVAAAECCHSPILALHAAVRSQSSWDFSRCHLYALSAHAIYAAAINLDRRNATASLIDRRGIDHAGASTATPLGIMALHRGQLLKITASRVDTIDCGLSATDIAWDPATQRLWLLDSEGNLSLRSPLTGATATIPSPADFRKITTVDNRVWLTDTDELYYVEQSPPPAALRPLAWQSAIDLPQGSRITAVTLRISATSFNGSIRLSARNATASADQNILRLNVNGSLNAPIGCRVAAPPRPFYSIAVEGTASADFQLHSITIHHSTPSK